MDYYYKAEEVREAAGGNWLYILEALAPKLSGAIQKKAHGKGHVPCPVHGGKDGFRLFDDVSDSGGGICNTCGSNPDGFALLMWVNEKDFTSVLIEVGDYLRCKQHPKRKDKGQARKSPVREALKRHGKTATPGDIKSEQKASNSQKPENPPKREKSADSNSKKIPARAKVTPIDRDVPPWLKEVKEEVEKRQARQKHYSAQKAVKIEKIWAQSVSIDSAAAEPLKKYFTLRKLPTRGLSDQSIRFHPKLDYFDEDGNLEGSFPAIICAIRDVEGRLVTLHRTYLTSTGKKARVKSAKKMMPIPDGLKVNGGAIRLGFPKDGVLGVAEGLETAQSAYRASGIPCWSTVNAQLLEGFEPPEGIHTLLIWADKDRSLTGELKAQALSDKLSKKGIKVITLIPPLPMPANKRIRGIDWNDVLISQGMLGFPSKNQLQAAIGANKCPKDKSTTSVPRAERREWREKQGLRGEVTTMPKQLAKKPVFDVIRNCDGKIPFDKTGNC